MTKKTLVSLLAAFCITLTLGSMNVSAATVSVGAVTIMESLGPPQTEGGSYSLVFQITNNHPTGAGVYSVLIAATEPAGTPLRQFNYVDFNWIGSLREITYSGNTPRVTLENSEATNVPGNLFNYVVDLPDSFTGYTSAYWFYTYERQWEWPGPRIDTYNATPLLAGNTMNQYVNGGTLGSPFVYWTEVSGGDTPQWSGQGQTVPVPASMLLLGSGLVGLAGFRKRIWRN
jgi:hypothetical protein